ncbi:MAG TPA: alpha/beta fold hydrolase [Mycobacteriales bacterium]|nr:alpha/beta fold hydrolase [Mycobacteriales bacterium]
MPTIERPGASIHWQDAGDGTPLLLIMGLRYSSAMWYPVIPSHAAEHRVVWFDNQGTGKSGARSTTTVSEMADDALAVLDAAGVESAHVYGVSMGGGIAMELALRAPDRVRSLILGCTAIKTEVVPALSDLQVRILKSTPGPIKRLVAKRGYGSAAPAEAVRRDLAMLSKDPFTWEGVVAQQRAVAAYSTDASLVAGIDVPVLVVHGTEDKTVPYAAGQHIAATIPGARLVTIEGAGHNYFVAGGEQANRETLAFLARIDATAPAAASP